MPGAVIHWIEWYREVLEAWISWYWCESIIKLILHIFTFKLFGQAVQLVQVNQKAADAIHQAAKAKSHFREGIARTGCRLDEREDWAEQLYFFRPDSVSKHADLLDCRVVE